jgi:hypothetical protein
MRGEETSAAKLSAILGLRKPLAIDAAGREPTTARTAQEQKFANQRRIVANHLPSCSGAAVAKIAVLQWVVW